MLWLGLLCGALALAVTVLLVQNALLRRAAQEIAEQLAQKLAQDTNTLISISGGGRPMRRLAAGINTQLRQLRRERQRFQQGDLELREAVTNISHDLRTPLTAICGYLDLLAREDKSEQAARYIALIENRAQALRELTEELFRYSVIASTTAEAAHEDVALGGALQESIAEQYAALRARGITPEISMPERPVLRRLDRTALSRILGNVIGNAVKYSDGDLSIVLRADGEMVFSNSAKDLSAVDVGRLFDRFFTVENGRGSTGLGLSIARLLTEQMGGRITADYAQGRLSVRLRL